MIRRSRTRVRPVVALLAAAGVLLLTACTADDPEIRPSASATTAPSTSAAATAAPYVVPEPTPDEIARTVFELDGPDGIPTTSLTSSGSVVADVPFSVEGQCVGDVVEFDVVRAIPGPSSGSVLTSGRLDCADGRDAGFAISTPYAGPVQLTLRNSEGNTAAWLRIVPGT